jgi:hypothetical protein
VDGRVAARGLPEHRDARRVPTEGADVAADPAQRLHLVEQTEVGGAAVRAAEVAEQPQPVGDGHHDEPLLTHQRGRVVGAGVTGAHDVRAAVQPHHDGQVVARCRVRGAVTESRWQCSSNPRSRQPLTRSSMTGAGYCGHAGDHEVATTVSEAGGSATGRAYRSARA